MKYQIDSPAELDLFDSQGHSNAAWAIQDTLENHENIHIIGLEGDLGAGKSTVLKLLENGMGNSRKKHHFFIFDVEQYHHSSTKASLIQFFSNKLKSTFRGNEEKVEEAKDKALGNILTYTKKIDSTLSLWTVAFAVLLYMFTRSAQDLFEQLKSLFSKLYFAFEKPDLTTKVPSELAFDFYPFLVFILILFCFWWFKFIKKEPIGNLVKRNTDDSISEKLLVTREVGSIELNEAFEVFTDAIPESDVVVLIIDNLDRVDKEKVREVWSDLQLFTSYKSTRFRVIVPFSEKQISIALSDSNEDGAISGREFISKRIPVVFRAPPLLSAGWRTPFKLYWEETLLITTGGRESCESLIELWLSLQQNITPRFLKKHLNDIASMLIASDKNKELSAVSCSAYILVQKYHPTLSFDHLISKKIDTSLEDKDARLIKLTQRILNKEFGGEDIWPREIMRIHYQTSEEKAMSELMTEPLNTAIEYLDYEEVLRLSSIYGFAVKFKDILRDCEPYEIIKIMSQISALPIEEQSNWNNEWLNEVNHRMGELKEQTSEEFDDDLVSSIKVIQENSSLKLNLARIKYECRNWLKKLGDIVEIGDRKTIFDEAYQYYELNNDSVVFKKIEQANSGDYIDILWPNREHYEAWRIPLREFNHADKKTLIKEIMLRDLSIVNDLLVHFSIQNKLTNKDSSLTNNDLNINDVDINDNSFASFLYSSEWGTKPLDKLISERFNVDESEFPEQWIALSIANSIISKTYSVHTERFTNYIKDYPNYIKYLSDYFTFATSYNNLLSYISDDIPSEISNIIIKLLIENRVNSLNIDELIKENYNDISQRLSENELLYFLDRLAAWQPYLKEFKFSSKWPYKFIEDVLNTQSESWLPYLIKEIENKDVRSWENEVLTTTKSIDLTITYYRKESKTLKSESSKALSDAIKAVCRKEVILDLFLEKFIKILAPLNKNGLVRSLSSDISKPSHKIDINEKILIIENLSPILDKLKFKDSLIDVDKIELLDSLTEENSKTIRWLDKQDWNSLDDLSLDVKDDFLRLVIDLNKKEELKYNLFKFVSIASEYFKKKEESNNKIEEN